MNNDKLHMPSVDFQMIFESSPDLYLVIDPFFKIVAVSQNYLKATMLTREDIIEKYLFNVFPDNANAIGVSHLRASLERVLKNKIADSMAVQRYDIRRPLEEGIVLEERYWSSINTPVFDENNEIKYIIHRMEDVTDFIKLRKFDAQQTEITGKLLDKTAQMELEIYRRAQELQEANIKLHIAKDLAEKLTAKAESDTKSKSDFLATMNHELRTSLNGVIGMTELLLDTPLSPQQLEFAETIQVSGESLLTIINDVLDYSKIESGHLQLRNIDFEIQVMVDQAIDVIIAQACRKRIEIGAYIDPDVPQWCFGDPVRIRQVLNNLLFNAIKFTKHGEISIWIKLVDKKNNLITLLFEVRDTGVGIEPEMLDNLFQPFSQGQSSTFSQYGGTGLGLCISKQLIELMGGNIYVESYPGKGSKFSFTLSIKESTIPSTPLTILPEFMNTRVLCVDDSDINRKVIQLLLTRWGMNCDVVDNAAKGISMLVDAVDKQDPYGLVFIDDCMPDMNGSELIKLIHRVNEISKTKVVILFSFGSSFKKDRLENLYVAASLSKPIQPIKLYSILVSVLQNQMHLIEPINPEVNEQKDDSSLNAHILLAEDNFINQQICLRVLHKLGLNSDVVTTGLDAVQAYKTTHYDLILMDCQMPEMDGYTATEEIRKEEVFSKKHVPIIAMTAYALKGDKEKCIQSGMDDYISKPISIKLLSKLIEKWLSIKK